MEQAIGHKIRKIRELKGFSQEYVASKLGITQNSYSKMERGETNVDEDKLTEIATVLEVEKEVIKNFSEQFVFNSCIQSGYQTGCTNTHTHNVNPIEKVQELYERLLADREAIIKQKEERISQLEGMLYKGK